MFTRLCDALTSGGLVFMAYHLIVNYGMVFPDTLFVGVIFGIIALEHLISAVNGKRLRWS